MKATSEEIYDESTQQT